MKNKYKPFFLNLQYQQTLAENPLSTLWTPGPCPCVHVSVWKRASHPAEAGHAQPSGEQNKNAEKRLLKAGAISTGLLVDQILERREEFKISSKESQRLTGKFQ